MQRFTHKSHWPDGHWTVPIVQFCDENGKLPQDGQFLPQAVIDRLAAYENAAENKAEIVRCRDCVHAPLQGEVCHGVDIEWPPCDYGGTDDKCPFCVGDRWYSQRPNPDFFCAYGERKVGKP